MFSIAYDKIPFRLLYYTQVFLWVTTTAEASCNNQHSTPETKRSQRIGCDAMEKFAEKIQDLPVFDTPVECFDDWTLPLPWDSR